MRLSERRRQIEEHLAGGSEASLNSVRELDVSERSLEYQWRLHEKIFTLSLLQAAEQAAPY
jgi:hypothetical protein